VTTLLLPKYLVPVRPRGTVFENYAVAVQAGRITLVQPREQALAIFPGAQRVELGNHVLLPGLINTHTHAPMSLLRGYADDLRLDTWLNDYIWPAEHRWAGAEFVRDGSELAVAEMIRGGTTCFNEMYFYPDQIAEVADLSGMRACVGMIVIDFKTAWASSFEEYLQKSLDVRSRYASNDRISFSIAPHSMYSVTSEMLVEIGQVSGDQDIPVHLHMLETEWEIENSISKHGIPPVQRVEQLGLLNDRLIAVHMAHLQDADIDLLAQHRVNVVHCPQSNLKLASGMCRVSDLVKAGVNVSIGTDGAASNNDLDLMSELQTAALLAKGVANDPSAVNAECALDMVTINGAMALGLAAEIGSIEVGKQADLCAVDLSHPRTQPVHHVISQIVYAASSDQVTDVWVAGRRLMQNRELTTVDEHDILQRAAGWSDKMRPEIRQREAILK
jgi:5-methylthioadenosine/S-adenosylhomocysteine deaminase